VEKKRKEKPCSHVVKIHFPISTLHTVTLQTFIHSFFVRWLDVSAEERKLKKTKIQNSL